MEYNAKLTRQEQFAEISKEITDSKEEQEKFSELLCELFDAINPEKITADFKLAVESHDYANALKILANYYRQKPYNTVSEISANGKFDLDKADKTVDGYMCEVNVDWHFENGEVDYYFDPTSIEGPQNPEWVWQFNRHTYWINLSRSYVASGDEKYTIAFEKQLLKWIAQTYLPDNWNWYGSAWRTIECGLRLLGSWQVAYDGFRRSDKLRDLSLILMIASMYKQSTHLVNHPTGQNWLMMEMNGVYTFSALFTELCDSQQNRETATKYLIRELEKQLLPDGMHNELSPDYQLVVFNCICNFYSLAKDFGFLHEIPDSVVELIRNTVDAAINLSTPAFTQPRTNDCYTIFTTKFTSRAAYLIGDTPEYQYFNSCREQGEAPKGDTASRFLPFAGFAVMRADWSKDSAYLCFDVGPLGLGHMHQDKLNINLFKGKEELIFDDGGGQYEFSEYRDYAISAHGHNTVLVDGLAQNRKLPLAVNEPIDISWESNAEYDYAVATYDDTFGPDFVKPATHKREIKFFKPDFFCITDTLTSADSKPHSYELLFHLDTTKVTPLEGYKNAVISNFGREYEILIIPVDCESKLPELKITSGVIEPEVKGWYNGRNESNLHKAITVSREVKNVENYKFTTLLFIVEKNQELPVIVKNKDGTITISFNKRNTVIYIK